MLHLRAFWLFVETFAVFFFGVYGQFGWFWKHLPVNSTAFVVVYALSDHICRVFLWRLRDDMLERSIERAKATRSGNSLRLEVRGTSNASFVASALPARASSFFRYWCSRQRKCRRTCAQLGTYTPHKSTKTSAALRQVVARINPTAH